MNVHAYGKHAQNFNNMVILMVLQIALHKFVFSTKC